MTDTRQSFLGIQREYHDLNESIWNVVFLLFKIIYRLLKDMFVDAKTLSSVWILWQNFSVAANFRERPYPPILLAAVTFSKILVGLLFCPAKTTRFFFLIQSEFLRYFRPSKTETERNLRALLIRLTLAV